ncbi:MAG: hypothetical protein GC190_05800 [Alphaproteobacteria bacterium]|nr:hypothetical protein [Alphaproteobacteria bacterium]
MKTLMLGTVTLVCATGLALAAQNTRYIPHPAASATPVAFENGSDRVCSKDREMLACVVQLGPTASDRWAYAITDAHGRPNTEVKYREPVSGAACAAMAYPVGHVVLAGGTGEFFNGKIRPACRQ